MDTRSLEALPNGATDGGGRAIPGVPLRPLRVDGLVVSRAALVAGLQLYVPQLVTIEPLGDGQFLLRLAGADQGEFPVEA